MSGGSEEEPVQKANLLVPRLAQAVEGAQTAVETVSSDGRNPVSAAATAITGGAWVSDPTAGNFVTDITGIGTAIRSAFDDAHSFLAGITEPATVEVPGPQAWKASHQSLRAMEY